MVEEMRQQPILASNARPDIPDMEDGVGSRPGPAGSRSLVCTGRLG